MKKVLAFVLALALVFGLAACTGTNPTSAPTTSPTTAPTTSPTTAPDKPTESQPTEPPLPSYVTDTAHPERYGGTVRAAYSAGFSSSWDPYEKASWTTWFWSINVFQSILIYGDDGQVYPQICDYELLDDGLTIKLTVRDGVKFSNGQDVTVEDIIASLKRSKEFYANTKTYLFDLLEYYDIEGKTITLHMKEANVNTFFNCLAQKRNSPVGVMPKEICEKYPNKENLIYDIDDVIGTGPYKLVKDECKPEELAVLVRNEYYTPVRENPEDNGLASPCWQYPDRLELYLLSDNTCYLALQNDELDVFNASSFENFNTMLEPLGTFKVTSCDTSTASEIFFNVLGDRPVKDVNLRKAIAAAFDYEEIQFSRFGKKDLWEGPLMKGVFPNYKSTLAEADYYNAHNKALAKQYLDKSSYNGEEIIIATDSGSAAIIENALKEIGINASSVKLDNSTLIAYSHDPNSNWDMIQRTNPVGANPAGWNYTFYEPWGNERAAELVGQLGILKFDSKESISAFDELIALIKEECPWVITGTNNHLVISPKTFNPGRKVNEIYYMYSYWDDPENH